MWLRSCHGQHAAAALSEAAWAVELMVILKRVDAWTLIKAGSFLLKLRSSFVNLGVARKGKDINGAGRGTLITRGDHWELCIPSTSEWSYGCCQRT